MDLAVATGIPLEALSDALAVVDEQGRIWPRNEKMRALLHSLENGSPRLADLPIGFDVLDRLAAGEVVEVEFGGELRELQCCHAADTRWLVARDHGGARAAAAQLAGARARMVGALAGTIVHDLANLLGAGIGLAELLRPLVREPADVKCLDDLARGARHGAVLGRAVARLLADAPRARTVIHPGILIDEVVLLLGKSAQRRGAALTACRERAPAAIRVASAIALQALLAGCQFCIDRGATAITIEADAVRQPIAGGRERSTVRIRVVGAPLGPDTVRDAVQLLAAQSGLFTAADRLGETGPGLLQAKAAMACAGGELLGSAMAAGILLDYVWPAVADPGG